MALRSWRLKLAPAVSTCRRTPVMHTGAPRRALVARIALRRQLGGVRWGSGDGGGALGVLGAFAAGLFVDVGAHQREGGGADVFAAGGVSIDLPALAGASR